MNSWVRKVDLVCGWFCGEVCGWLVIINGTNHQVLCLLYRPQEWSEDSALVVTYLSLQVKSGSSLFHKSLSLISAVLAVTGTPIVAMKSTVL